MEFKLISFVVSETPKVKKGTELPAKPIESAPQYYEETIPKQFAMGEEELVVAGKKVKFLIRSYPPENMVVEATVSVDDIFSAETFALREALIGTCHKISQKRGAQQHLSEEYSVALVSGYQGDPEQFLDKKQEIAAFLKSEKEPLDEHEIEYTLSKQIKYAKETGKIKNVDDLLNSGDTWEIN